MPVSSLAVPRTVIVLESVFALCLGKVIFAEGGKAPILDAAALDDAGELDGVLEAANDELPPVLMGGVSDDPPPPPHAVTPKASINEAKSLKFLLIIRFILI